MATVLGIVNQALAFCSKPRLTQASQLETSDGAVCLESLNSVVQEIYTEDWWWNEVVGEISPEPGSPLIPVPDTVFRFRYIRNPYYNCLITPKDYARFYASNPNPTEEGEPYNYWIEGGMLRLYPTPTSATSTYPFTATTHPPVYTSLDANVEIIEVPLTYHWVLRWGVILDARLFRNDQEYRVADAKFSLGKQKMQSHNRAVIGEITYMGQNADAGRSKWEPQLPYWP